MSNVLNETKPLPSAWKVEMAFSAYASARSRILSTGLVTDEATLSDLLGAEEGDIKDILARVLRGARHSTFMAEQAAEMLNELKARQDRYKRRAEELRALAFAMMDSLGQSRFELPDLTASIRAGVPGLILSEDAVLTEEYVRITRSPDRAAIIADLKQGVVIDGAVLSNGIATLSIRGT